MNRRHRRQWIPLTVFVIWFGLQFSGLLAIVASGESLVDFQTYEQAAAAISEGRSPYADSTEAAQEPWLRMHHEIFLARNIEVIPGPYLYPPSLGLFLAQTGLSQTVFTTLIFLALVGFCLVWLTRSDATYWWLIIPVLSWDVIATFSGGNFELISLFGIMLFSILFWRGYGWLAGPVAALMLLVKPFLILYFIAFAVLTLRSTDRPRRIALQSAFSVLSAAFIVGVEVWRWPEWLRVEAWNYLLQAADYTYLGLPAELQQPASDWNRAPLQLFVTAGLDTGTAQVAALALWGFLLGLTVVLIPRGNRRFALMVSAAWILLLFGRPLTFTLPYLEMIVLSACWPWLQRRWLKIAALTAAVILMVSHWVALGLTAMSVSAATFSLQTVRVPWETVIIFPGALALTLWAARRTNLNKPRGCCLKDRGRLWTLPGRSMRTETSTGMRDRTGAAVSCADPCPRGARGIRVRGRSGRTNAWPSLPIPSPNPG